MIAYLVQVSICMAVFFAFYYFLLRRETLFHSNRLYLLLTLALSFVLPALRIYILEAQAQGAILHAPLYMASYMQSVEEVITIRPDQEQFPLGKLLFILYVSMMLVLFVRLGTAIRSILQIRRNAQANTGPGITTVSSPEIQYPFSFFNTIYLPVDHGFSKEELTEVLRHEQAHVKGRHSWDVLLAEIACIVMWPSPFVYLYRKALRDIHEYVADAAVLKNTPWDRYAAMLVAHRQTRFQMRLANPLIFSQLKKRLLMMNQKPSPTWKRLKYLGVIPVLGVALILFSFRSRPAEPEVPNPLFPGCATAAVDQQQACSTEKLFTFISAHLIYPPRLKEDGMEGTVVIKFVVGADGWLKDIDVKESLHPDADQVVLDLFRNMNVNAGKWTPAMKEGKAVDTELCIPVRFKLDGDSTDPTLLVAEEMPRLDGCEQITDANERMNCANAKMYKYIYEHLTYPEADRTNGVEGQGIVQFVISTEGRMEQIDVVRSPSETIKAELLSLFEKMAKETTWIPAKDKGQPVNLKYTVPVKFVLQSDQDKNKPSNAKAGGVTNITEKEQVSLTVTPNPAQSTISINVNEGVHTLVILDANGRQVSSQRVGKADYTYTLDIAHLPKGSYVVQAIANDYTRSAAFVKE